jgi:hypothetical protein
MAAGAFTVFRKAKGSLGKATLNLSTGVFYMGLFNSAAAANITGNLSTYGSLGNEVSATGGYASGGKVLSGVTWVTAGSAGQWMFDSTAVIFTASGASINNIRYAVIRQSAASVAASKVVAHASLTTAQFTLASGNTLTVTPNASGFFRLA